jgi:hypothetical protein
MKHDDDQTCMCLAGIPFGGYAVDERQVCASAAYCRLGVADNELRQRRIIPMILAEMGRRARLTIDAESAPLDGESLIHAR